MPRQEPLARSRVQESVTRAAITDPGCFASR